METRCARETEGEMSINGSYWFDFIPRCSREIAEGDSGRSSDDRHPMLHGYSKRGNVFVFDTRRIH
jgi:hypothetical protein